MNERLKAIRIRLDMGVLEFAKILNISPTTFLMMEEGRRDILDRHISVICDMFGVNQDWFCYGIGDAFKYKRADLHGDISKILEFYTYLDNDGKVMFNNIMHTFANEMNANHLNKKATV